MSTASGRASHAPFVGRAAELDDLCDLVRGGDNRVGLVRGEPGIGKTELLSRVADQSRGRMVRVAGSEAETHLPFAALADLVLPLRSTLDALPDVQREALEISIAVRAGAAPGPLAVCAALVTLLECAGDEEVLLVVVDDLQWVDPPSLEVLLFVARRLRSRRVTLLFATRETCRVMPGALVVDLGRLPATESRQLLGPLVDRLPPVVVDRLVTDLDGHPLALVENARHDHHRSARRVRPGPALTTLWTSLLESLPERPRTAVTVVAAAGSATRDVIGQVLADLGLTRRDLDPGERVGLLRADDGLVALRHPLLRDVVLAAHPDITGRVHHALAARTSGIRRAWHLAARIEGTDDVVSGQLAAAARAAAARGGHRSAAEAWSRAAQLSSDRRVQAELCLEAAQEFVRAGALDLAQEHAEAAIAHAGDPASVARAEIVRGRAVAWSGNPRSALDGLLRAAERLGPDDAAAAAVLLGEATTPAAMTGRVREMLTLARRAGTSSAWTRRSPEAQALVLSGDIRAALAILDEVDHGSTLDDPQDHAQLAQVALAGERYTDADRRIEALLARARVTGTSAMLAFAHLVRSELDLWRGRWPAARADAVEAVQWATEGGEAGTRAVATLLLARLDALVGDVGRCHERSRLVQSEVGSHGIDCLLVYVPAVEGLAALVSGDPDGAVDHLERAHRRARTDGLEASNVVPYGPDLVEALVRAGSSERAREVLSWWEEKAESGLAFPTATAARCHGLLATDADEATRWFDRAAEAHARSEQPFERGRTELARAEVLRRLRRPGAARAAARDAHSRFVALDARPWASRAEAELAAAGVPVHHHAGRRRSWAELTPQEFQVARAVAEGRSNDEAAASLFVSRKTVENHLTRIYRKLGLRSRTDLVRVFPGHEDTAR